MEEYKVEIVQDEIRIIEVCAQGPPGPPGPPGSGGSGTSGEITYQAAIPISGHRAVATNALGQVIYADNTVAWHRNAYAGISVNAAAASSPVLVRYYGEITEVGWNWVVNAPIYFIANGVLTQTPPSTSGSFIKIIAIANSPTSIFLTENEAITIS
jgi:hypothetical protein